MKLKLKEVSNFILLHLVPWYRTTLLRLCCVYLCICVFVYLCVFVFVYLSIWYQTTLFWLRAYLCVFDATWWLVACRSRVQLNSSLIMRPDNNRGDTLEEGVNSPLWFLRRENSRAFLWFSSEWQGWIKRALLGIFTPDSFRIFYFWQTVYLWSTVLDHVDSTLWNASDRQF